MELRVIQKPNTNFKPRTREIHGIVIHSMGEFIGGVPADEFLQNIKLSAHYLIGVDGTIIKCVEPIMKAYHAGKSAWQDETNLNGSYVGIEILVEGDHTWESFVEAIENPDTFKEAQYTQTAALCRSLREAWPAITLGRIVRHSDVSGVEVRPESPKIDPGSGFDWDYFMELVAS